MVKSAENVGFWKIIWNWVKEYSSPYITLAGGGILGFAINHLPWPPKFELEQLKSTETCFLILGVVVCVIGILIEQQRSKDEKDREEQLQQLRSENEELDQEIDDWIEDYRDLTYRWLRLFLKAQNLHENTLVRVSLYGTEDGKVFYLQGRYCDNAEWSSPGRASYKSSGIIAKAYKENEAFESCTVNPTDQQGAKTDEYINWHHETWGQAKADAKRLRMPSRHYAAKALRDNNKKTMVLMVETVESENNYKTGYFDKDPVKKELASLTRKLIRYKHKAPIPTAATSEGF